MISETTSIFDNLPGLEIPVAKISEALSHVWEGASDRSVNPAEFRATQMNLIIHLGRETELGEAKELFETALRFSRRHPSRILILCPDEHSDQETLLTSKIFSECYIGKSGRERSCCEAIIVAYPTAGRNYLEDQVSVLLENDLPTYYWQHRFQKAHRLTGYRFFFEVSRRVVYDSRREGQAIRETNWPKPEIVRDLAAAALLPVRQAIGQFLSRFSPEELVRNLDKVEVRRSDELEAEALILRDWVHESLLECSRVADRELRAEFECCPGEGVEDFELEICFSYTDGRYFRWIANRETGIAEIDAKLGKRVTRIPTVLKLLPLEEALAEAFFS